MSFNSGSSGEYEDDSGVGDVDEVDIRPIGGLLEVAWLSALKRISTISAGDIR